MFALSHFSLTQKVSAMRESENKTGYTRVDHVVFDLVLPVLSTNAQAVFLRIYRQTVGWDTPYDKIANSRFRKYTGIKSETTIRAAITELESLCLIEVEGEIKEIKEYGINWLTLEIFGIEGAKAAAEAEALKEMEKKARE